jgi:acylphosphatase/uncharacterized protein YjbJ (UPF0337 family)
MVKLRIVIRGPKVQDVGYRLFLLSGAGGLQGFEAHNVGEDLEVLVEGGDEASNRFLEFVKQQKPPQAQVSEIKTEPYSGWVMDKSEFRSQFSLEQLVKLTQVGLEMSGGLGEMKGDIKEMKGDIKEMKGDIKEMKGDIKEMKGDIKEMKGDIKEMKGDIKTVLVKQDDTIREIKDLRQDLRSYMEERFGRLESDVKRIKEKIGLAP